MKIAIIGAGAAGLCAGRHCLANNFQFDIFEQTGNVGGTWNYTDNVYFDENGIPVHSSMYKNLRTNLPKELMSFEDFPYPCQQKSYLPQEEVLNYIQSYCDNFHLKSYIKMYKRVILIEPQNNKWLVKYEDVKNKNQEEDFYNAVIVCNGHYSDPFVPEIPGIDNFTGGYKHSHYYRSPEEYKNKKVLVIGAGPSGLDISQQISNVATKVFLSHRSLQLKIPDNIIEKPVVDKCEKFFVVFNDGTTEPIDDILFCTGYNFSFPFLSDKCGVKIDNNYVHPLYKQIMSVENPSLAFIGLPFIVCPFPLFDVQVRFFLSSLNGHFSLPSKEEMLKELKIKNAQKVNTPLRKYHLLGDNQGNYFEDLTKTANIQRVPPVIHKLYMRVKVGRNLNDCFRIVDEENWEQIY